MSGPVVVWFRNDLRLADNPALEAAVASGRDLVLLYVLDDEAPGRWRPGGASRWWLHHSLERLAGSLRGLGAALVLRSGDSAEVIGDIVAATRASGVYWNRRYDPWAVAQDSRIKAQLRERGIEARSWNGSLVHEPWEICGTDGPALVFSPFHRAWLAQALPPLGDKRAPSQLSTVADLTGERLADWKLLPTAPDWAGGLREAWEPGEAGAWRSAEAFMAERLAGYRTGRHQLGREGVSRLSPHLRFGEIAPRRLVAMAGLTTAFSRQLAWRDFAAQLLFFRPDLPELELQPAMRGFPWRDDPAALTAWQRGRTGYPLVDAGMRQLRRSGWMHNRARMVVASFLTRHLLIDWRHGQDWFWDELVDADLASNAMNWQWVAGSGTDTTGFGRIFNPIKQGIDLDPDGAYVRRWVRELADCPAETIHLPPPPDLLGGAGSGYPPPLVDLQEGRARALATYDKHMARRA
ncbi:MAG: deoxyribodipyrimidine photo-lyase [Geminicoccaceae bacterium]